MKFDCKYDEMVPVEEIKEHPRNNNRHPVEQIEMFERILSKIKVWRMPLIISKKTKTLVSGHLRLTAAKNMGIKLLPVVYQTFKNEAAEYQFLTSNNEMAKWSRLDRQDVHLALEELEGLDLEDLGIENWEFPDIEPEEPEPEKEKSNSAKLCPNCGHEF